MAKPQKPLLLLRDYLELDPNSDSRNSFASFPRKCPDSPSVRFLLEAELIRPSALPGSKTSPLSAFINAIKNFPISSPTRPRPKPRAPDESRSLSRSLSKRLSRKFWRKKKQEKEEAAVVTVNDIVRLKSFDETRRDRRRTLYFPSPVVSSSSSCSDDAEQRSESFASSSSGNSVDVQSQNQSQNQNLYQNPIQPSEKGVNEKLECKGFQSEEEKEQLSPISVMNFPYQEEGDKNEGEEDETSSSGSEQNLANIKRSRHRLPHKIRRFETLADLVDPLNLDLRSASTEDEADRVHVASSHAITARDLIQRLRSNLHGKPQSDKLLFDFFVDELSWSVGTTNEHIGRLLPAAADWINGKGFIKKEEHGKSQLVEMERNGRWRCFGFEKDDVAADVEVGILESLLHELVLELADTD